MPTKHNAVEWNGCPPIKAEHTAEVCIHPFSIKLKTRHIKINTAGHKIHTGDVYFAEIKPSTVDRLSNCHTGKGLEIQLQFRIAKSETQKSSH